MNNTCVAAIPFPTRKKKGSAVANKHKPEYKMLKTYGRALLKSITRGVEAQQASPSVAACDVVETQSNAEQHVVNFFQRQRDEIMKDFDDMPRNSQIAVAFMMNKIFKMGLSDPRDDGNDGNNFSRYGFVSGTVIVPLRNNNGHDYIIGHPAVMSSVNEGIMYCPDRDATLNHMSNNKSDWRFATDQEIDDMCNKAGLP